MKVTFSWRLIAAIASTTAVAGVCLAGCGSSSPTVTVTVGPSGASASASASAAGTAQSGAAGLPLGPGSFEFHGSVTEFDDSAQSTTIQGTVAGLALTATGTGDGLSGGGFTGQNGDCGLFGLTGTSATGTLGGVPFNVTLTGCSTDSDDETVTATYTGQWSGRAVNVALTTGVANTSTEIDGTTQLTGTVGAQQVSGTVPNIVLASGAPGNTYQISGTISVS